MAVALTGLVLGISGCVSDASRRPDQRATAITQHPTLALLDLDGHAFDLLNRRPASTTVVVFTRTDCPISNRFAPEIIRLHEKYHAQGVEFFLVYVDPDEQPEAIRRHLREYAYPCKGLRDPAHALVAHCQASATPEAAVFNRDGDMTYLGRINDLYVDLGRPRAKPTTYDLADAIESTVHGRPVATPRTRAIGCLIADVGR